MLSLHCYKNVKKDTLKNKSEIAGFDPTDIVVQSPTWFPLSYGDHCQNVIKYICNIQLVWRKVRLFLLTSLLYFQCCSVLISSYE